MNRDMNTANVDGRRPEHHFSPEVEAKWLQYTRRKLLSQTKEEFTRGAIAAGVDVWWQPRKGANRIYRATAHVLEFTHQTKFNHEMRQSLWFIHRRVRSANMPIGKMLADYMYGAHVGLHKVPADRKTLAMTIGAMAKSIVGRAMGVYAKERAHNKAGFGFNPVVTGSIVRIVELDIMKYLYNATLQPNEQAMRVSSVTGTVVELIQKVTGGGRQQKQTQRESANQEPVPERRESSNEETQPAGAAAPNRGPQKPEVARIPVMKINYTVNKGDETVYMRAESSSILPAPESAVDMNREVLRNKLYLLHPQHVTLLKREDEKKLYQALFRKYNGDEALINATLEAIAASGVNMQVVPQREFYFLKKMYPRRGQEVNGMRVSLAQKVLVEGIEEFYEKLNMISGLTLPVPEEFHVSIFSNNETKGIGFSTESQAVKDGLMFAKYVWDEENQKYIRIPAQPE